MENNHTPSGDLMVKRKRGCPRKHPIIESNVQSTGPASGFSMTQPQIRQRDNGKAVAHFKNNHTLGDLMVKRKPGRPRKYLNIESNVQSTGPRPGFSMIQAQIHQRNNRQLMVGQAIRGVVERTFEDGFFLSVKVENSDSMLRGVVFRPGHSVPVSVHNDVAPHLPMIRRQVVHRHPSANGARRYAVSESRGSGDRRPLVLVPIQPAHPTIPTHRVAPVVRRRPLVPVPAQPARPAQPAHPSHPTIPTHGVVPVVRGRSLVLVPPQPTVPALPAQPDSGDRSLVPVPIHYAQHAHHGSANGGRKSTVREWRDSGDRSLVPVPIRYNLPAQPGHPANPTQLAQVPVPTHPALVPVPAVPSQLARAPAQPALPVHPTIPAHCVVPVVLQRVHQQNGGGAHQAIIKNHVVPVRRQAPHLRMWWLPVNRGPM